MSLNNQILLQIKNNYSFGSSINFNLFDFSESNTDSYKNATTNNAYEYQLETDFPRTVDEPAFYLTYRLKGSSDSYSRIVLNYLDYNLFPLTNFYQLAIPLKNYFDMHPEMGIYIGPLEYGQETGNFIIVSEIYEFAALKDFSD